MIRSYVRVSTIEQAADDKSSIDQQRQKIIGAAMMRGVREHEIEFYTDAGISGSVPLRDRPSGAKLLAETVSGDVIVAAKLDRLFRSASDALQTVEQLARQKVGVILADIGTDPVTENGVSKLFFSMLAAFAEFERTRIAERMRDGKRGKAARGGYTGTLPYGFSKVGVGREARLVPNHKERRLIELIIQLRETPMSVEKIIAQLNKRELFNRRGNPFAPHQIERILKANQESKHVEVAPKVETREEAAPAVEPIAPVVSPGRPDVRYPLRRSTSGALRPV